MPHSSARLALVWSLGGVGLLVLAAGVWAALASLPNLPRERVIVVSKVVNGAAPQPFPSNIHLTLGLQDVLVLRNEDDRSQLIGGIEVSAGQSLRIPFSRVQDFQLACSAHPSGQSENLRLGQAGSRSGPTLVAARAPHFSPLVSRVSVGTQLSKELQCLTS